MGRERSPASEVCLNEYELLYIVHPRKAADEVPSVVDWVSDLVQQGGGEPLSVDNWGRRRLAYPIAHEFEGSYVLATFRLPPESTTALESQLVISEDIMRHILIHGVIPFESRRETVERTQAVATPSTSNSVAGATAELPAEEPVAEEPAAEEPAAEEPPAEEPPAEESPAKESPAEATVEASEGEDESASQVAEPSPATAGAE